MKKRKRIALFANGWVKESLQEAGAGICRCAAERDADVFAFINYSVSSEPEEERGGEFNIFLLPDLKDFDGVLLLANSFNLHDEPVYLSRAVREAGIPTISMAYELEGLDSFCFENYSGMYELACHMIREHGVQKILFMGGIRGHADSEERLQAVQDAARDNGLAIRAEDIVYGDYSEVVSGARLEQWLNENGDLPDAIMCANDMMALGVCQWLEAHGYLVPDDVKVTGYDFVSQGQEKRPVLTTIGRDWENLGYRAVQALLDRIAGNGASLQEKAESRIMYGESCGCRKRDDEPRKRGIGRNLLKNADSLTLDQHFRHMYMCVRKNETLEQFHGSLSAFFGDAFWMEGKNFMLCIHPSFFSLDEPDETYRKAGYPPEVDVICALRDGEPEDYQRLPVKETIFRASERSEEPGLYIFVPVRSDDKNLGFAMLTTSFDVVNNSMLYIWTRHVNQYMEQVRANVKIAELTKMLQEMSVTDVLTGLYNRMGCEKILYPLAERCQEKGGRSVVMLADIDRMKVINDQYGHSQGDLALKTLAEALKRGIPNGYLAGRFGGDEFLVVGEEPEEVSILEIADQISRCLREEIERQKLTFPLSVSIGGTQLEKGETFQLNQCLQKADEVMYRIKESHHRQMDGGEG